MKVVIICGGKGERLREETEFKPKPLVEIGGMPILVHIMKIYSHYGFKEFILCLGYKGNMIKEYFLHLSEMAYNFTLKLGPEKEIIHHIKKKIDDWKITFVDTGLETLSGGRVARIQEYLDDDEDFFYTYGDGLSTVNINELYDFHKKMNKVVTLVGVNPPSQYGVIELDGKIAKTYREKPTLNGIINGGFWVCNKKVFNYITPDENCPFEEYPLINLTNESQLAVYKYDGYWDSMDTYKQAARLNSIWDSGKAPWKVWD